MSPAPGTDVFTATIPGQDEGELVRYRITSPTGGQEYPTGDGRNYEGVVVDDPSELETGLVKMEWFIPEGAFDHILDGVDIFDGNRESRPFFDRTRFVQGSVLAIDGVVYDNMRVNVRGGDFARENFEKQGLSFDFPSGLNVLNEELVPYEIDEFALIAERGWTYNRAFTAWNLFYDAGFPVVHAQHVRVQRNGDYYGIFRFSEKLDGEWRDANDIDGDFFKAESPGFDDPFIPEDDERGFDQNQGDDFSGLIELSSVLRQGPSQSKTDYFYDNVDIANAVNFLAVANIVGHFDSNEKNFFMHHDATTGLWEILPWDLSNVFGVPPGSACSGGDVLEVNCRPNEMWRSISEIDELDEMVFRRMRTLVDGPLAAPGPEDALAAHDPLVSSAEQLFDADDDQWSRMSSYRTVSAISAEIEFRRDLVLDDDDTPEAQPAAPEIVINEIVHSAANGSPDWLELHNPSNESVDISDWTIDGANFTAPGGTIILPGHHIVATRDVRQFLDLHPDLPNTVVVPFDGGLGGGGELLELVTDDGVVIDSVDYANTPPWPSDPAAGVKSLSLMDPADDNSDGSNWGISVDDGGDPGEANNTVGGTVAPPPAVVINELHYNPADGGVEFVELFNAEDDTVDISGWDLDGMITFAGGTEIASGEYFVATENLADFQALYPGVAAVEWDPAEGLSNGGENVRLEDENGVSVDAVEYDDRDDWPTEPDGDGPSLELIDPALDNSEAVNWEVSLPGGSPGINNSQTDNEAPATEILSPLVGDVVSVDPLVVVGTAFDDVGVDFVRVRVVRDADPGPGRVWQRWNGSAWVGSEFWFEVSVGADGAWEFSGVVDGSVGDPQPGIWVQAVAVDTSGNVAATLESEFVTIE